MVSFPTLSAGLPQCRARLSPPGVMLLATVGAVRNPRPLKLIILAIDAQSRLLAALDMPC